MVPVIVLTNVLTRSSWLPDGESFPSSWMSNSVVPACASWSWSPVRLQECGGIAMCVWSVTYPSALRACRIAC